MSARRLARAAWDRTEAVLDNRAGRPVLRALSRLALRLQYPERVSVGWSDGVWEYRWPNGIVMSDRALPTRARPGDIGAPHYLWAYTPKPGDVIVDVGAGVGEELHEFVPAVGPSGKVIAVEAHPRLCIVLDRLCQANGWRNVVVVNAAITDGPGVVTLTDERASDSNDIFRPGTLRVPAQSLPELLHELDLDHVDFLKMNIEGAETLALEGMGMLTARRIANAAISCHDWIGRATKAPVQRILDGYGFEVREHPAPALASRADCLYATRRSEVERDS